MSKIIKMSVFGLMALVLIFSTFVTVGVGERGVKTRFGSVVGELAPGLHTKIPFVEHVVVFDTQVQKEQTSASAASSDLQTVSTQIATNYKVSDTEGKVSDLYSRVGADYKTRVIDPSIQEAVKSVTARYTAEQLITKRTDVTAETITALKEKLGAYDIEVTSVNIVDFDFSPQFNAAIEAKVTAEQNALAAKNKLDQVKYEAEQKVATAEADAKATRLVSDAANNEKYIQLKQLEVQKAAIEKWNGVLPTQFVPGSALPFINLK